MNEIVKYDNYMNSLKFTGFTATDLNFLMVLCNKLRNKDISEITISFEELRDKTGYTQTSVNKFVSDLERMNKKLMEITCRLKTETEIIMFVLFPTFVINLDRQLLKISVNEKFQFILNELVKNFTSFELNEFVGLDSKYTKNLYRLLKQYRSTGRYEVSVDKFREIMDIPESYTNRDMKNKIINISLNKLKDKFLNLQCVPQYASKRGRPVTGYIFTFVPETSSGHKQAGNTKTGGSKQLKNTFENFSQRKYDYEKLEREILSRNTACSPGEDTDKNDKYVQLERELMERHVSGGCDEP